MEKLEKLNANFYKDLSIEMVLNSMPITYDQLILTYHLNNTETTLIELDNLLQTIEEGTKKFHSNSSKTVPVMAIKQIDRRRERPFPNPNGKGRPMLEGVVVGLS